MHHQQETTGGRSAVALCTALLVLASCIPSQSKPVAHNTPAADSSVPGNLGLVGQGAMLTLPDPKHPRWLLWKLWVKNYTGDLAANNVTAQGVVALLYKNGQRNAKLYAPKATGNTSTETIHATGGVTYNSLTQAGTTIHAQTILWNARTKRGEAWGNVHYHNGKNGLNAIGPVFYFNSQLSSFTSTPPGH